MVIFGKLAKVLLCYKRYVLTAPTPAPTQSAVGVAITTSARHQSSMLYFITLNINFRYIA